MLFDQSIALYDKDLAKRFVSDCKLPIPIISEELFTYYLWLYDLEFKSLEKYNKLIEIIHAKFHSDPREFLQDYYDIREDIIQFMENRQSFQDFNTMDISQYTKSIKGYGIPKNNIFNGENVGYAFLSVDLKQANVQALNFIDRDILMDSDTYEDFVRKFTDSEYFRNSKYTREVIFGKLNPKRHIQVETYIISQIYDKLVKDYPILNSDRIKPVSMVTDEIVFRIEDYHMDDHEIEMLPYGIVSTVKDMGFRVKAELFKLRGFQLWSSGETSRSTPFFTKEPISGDIPGFKLISCPLPYHAVAYKLYKKLVDNDGEYEVEDNDMHFAYEGLDCMFCDDFELREMAGHLNFDLA